MSSLARSIRNTQARATQSALASVQRAGASRKPSSGFWAKVKRKVRKTRPPAAGAAKTAPKRIRWIEEPNKVVALVEERRGLRWQDTGIREEVDLDVAAKAMRVYDARNGNTAGDDTAGFGDRLRRFAKRVAKSKVGKVVIKAHTAPLKAVHKITHHKNSPIRKAEMALQKYVGKALPFTKPFIAVHNKLAGGVHKVVKAAGDGKSIKKAMKKGAKAAKPNANDINNLASAAATAAGGAADGVKLPAGAAKAVAAGAKAVAAAKPTAKELAALVEERRKVLANGISTALKKVPEKDREAVKKELIRKSTSWTTISPRTGIKYEFQL